MHVYYCQVSTIANLAYLRGYSSVVPETLTKVKVHKIKTFRDICHVIIRVATSAQLKVRVLERLAGQSCQYTNIVAIVQSLEASWTSHTQATCHDTSSIKFGGHMPRQHPPKVIYRYPPQNPNIRYQTVQAYTSPPWHLCHIYSPCHVIRHVMGHLPRHPPRQRPPKCPPAPPSSIQARDVPEVGIALVSISTDTLALPPDCPTCSAAVVATWAHPVGTSAALAAPRVVLHVLLVATLPSTRRTRLSMAGTRSGHSRTRSVPRSCRSTSSSTSLFHLEEWVVD